ncbi:MAG TPA: hypothetical protein PLV68_12220, partial [Ilumatobacteraceae bacterium]|nr:hypothetical protein [Ilumatobacteraceae bacterium]
DHQRHRQHWQHQPARPAHRHDPSFDGNLVRVARTGITSAGVTGAVVTGAGARSVRVSRADSALDRSFTG